VWGVRLQVPVPEAVIATRLSFRPPEGISPFNAARLSRFVRSVGKVDWGKVNSFPDAFGLEGVAAENLRRLRPKRIQTPARKASLRDFGAKIADASGQQLRA
jgi:hypothetical protein